MSKFWQQLIGKYFDKQLLPFTNAAIGFGLGAVSDGLVQKLEKRKGIDLPRTYKMAVAFGAIAFFNHYWYIIIDKPLYSKSKLKRVFIQTFLDLAIGAPINLTIFLITCSIFEKTYVEGFKESINQKAYKIYFAEATVNPILQFVNFYFVPPRYRVLYDNSVSMVENMYICYVQQNE